MIIPAYSLTATERVLPRLALDFTTGVLDTRVTVARALNTATRVNDSGYIELVSANLPRFDYSAVTIGACKGLLIEETRTNLLIYSSQIDDASWVKTGLNTTGTPAYIDVAVSPDGTQNADKMIEDANNSQHNARVSASLAATTAHAYSFYAKAAGRTEITVTRFNSAVVPSFAHTFNLTAVTSSGGTITDAGNGWYRCSGSFTTTGAGVGGFVVNMSDGSSTTYTGNGTSGIFIWGAQLEAGAFATSYIPTTTTSLTRNADVVNMTGTNFSSWYNATEGTFVSDIITNVIGGNTVAFSTGSFSDGMYCLATAGGNYFVVRSGNVTQTSLGSAAFIVGNNRVATGYKASNFATALNGNATNTTSSGNLPTVSTLTIGSLAGSLLLNGWAQKLFFYPQLLTQNEIRAFSKR